MALSDDELRALLSDPREALDFELKQWLDPATPECIAKVAKGCLALRNQNGGLLVFGFTDDGKPDVGNAPADVRATFRPDTVQDIVSKYAHDPFPVDVRFVLLDGQEYPVIVVGSGVRTPVAAKSDLKVPDGRLLVKNHAVYVRSLAANGRVSSTEVKREDWARLTQVCFDNREADIGAFVRRQLASLDLAQLGPLLGLATRPVTPTGVERATALLARGRDRFDEVVKERGGRLPQLGLREAAIVIDGEVPAHPPTESFLNRLMVEKPRHSGWSPWVAYLGPDPDRDRPFVFEGGWEFLIAVLSSPLFAGLDFWRIDPQGEF